MGVDYLNKRGPTRRFEIALCLPGEPIELRLEPTNKADPRAIAVYSARGVQLGYLTAERAPLIGLMMSRSEAACIFQEATQRGAIVRVAFGGEVPTLPPAREENVPESDCWPDEEWPDI